MGGNYVHFQSGCYFIDCWNYHIWWKYVNIFSQKRHFQQSMETVKNSKINPKELTKQGKF